MARARRRRSTKGRHLPFDLPAGARILREEGPGPFTTHVLYELADGRRREWSSRRHRKRRGAGGAYWAPGRLGWWIAALFAVGSFCFILGSVPGYASLVGVRPDALTYFIGGFFACSIGVICGAVLANFTVDVLTGASDASSQEF